MKVMQLFHVHAFSVNGSNISTVCEHYEALFSKLKVTFYPAGGLPDCAPGKCPKTAEISPIKCSSDPVLFFNNGYPMLCQEGFTCDAAAADAGEGNPCKAAEDGAGYE